MKSFNSEIIAVGTELLLGQITNTNAQWLSEQLASYGINTFYHTVVGDNLNRVKEVFIQAQNRSDVIIVTGGLGPTDDDLTREAFQGMSQLELEEDSFAIEKIEQYYKNQRTIMTPNNRKQARVFQGARVIKNKVGMAPGMIVTYKGKIWVFLPGVPREMKQMATDDVFPYLTSQSGEKTTIKSLILRFIGIGESKLEHELSDLIRSQSNPTIAPLAQNDGVVIRLTAKDISAEAANQRLKETEDKILARTGVGEFFYGYNDETIEGKVVALLKERNDCVAAAESLTGGMFIDRLISVDGAGEVCPGGIVCYDPKVKQHVLQVSADTIKNEGVVSDECAAELAKNVCDVLGSDIGISFTGVAGPNSLEGQPPGTVYIGIYSKKGEQFVGKFTFPGDRNAIRRRSVIKGFELLLNYLK